MAAEMRVKIVAELSGLGEDINFAGNFTGTTPTKVLFHYLEQDTADTEQALELGDVTTEDMLIIKCVANDVDIDLDFDTTFNVDLTIGEGKWAVIPQPAGTVYIKNNGAGEKSTIQYLLTDSA